MKMPLFIKKSVYAKMPMFFGGGEIPLMDSQKKETTINYSGMNKGFQPVQPFKSAFQDPQLLAAPDVKLPEKPSWMNTYQPEDNISDPSIQPFPVDDTPRSQSGSFNPAGMPTRKQGPDEDGKSDTMGTLRDGMYVGNALLRGLSEGNANRQMEQYEQMNTANPLANMAYNDGRSEDVTFGYEQFMKGGFYKKMGKKRNC